MSRAAKFATEEDDGALYSIIMLCATGLTVSFTLTSYGVDLDRSFF
jgi:hypothetical protein